MNDRCGFADLTEGLLGFDQLVSGRGGRGHRRLRHCAIVFFFSTVDDDTIRRVVVIFRAVFCAVINNYDRMIIGLLVLEMSVRTNGMSYTGQ